MNYRFPDNPMRISELRLAEIAALEGGDWLSQPKLDGWRRPMYRSDGTWSFHSKHGTGKAAVLPDPSLVEELESLRLPDGIGLDGEMLGRRCSSYFRGEQALAIWDLLYEDGQWVGGQPIEERLRRLNRLLRVKRARGEWAMAGSLVTPRVLVVKTSTEHLDLYHEQKGFPASEGIVMKRRSSSLVGSFTKSMDNPDWLKIKYRE